MKTKGAHTIRKTLFISAGSNGSSSLIHEKKNLFYIGENIALVANLARAYDMGYTTSINLAQAKSFLRQLRKEGYRFSGFLVDLPLQVSQLRDFNGYLSGTPYENLPVLYVSTRFNGPEIQEISALRLVDDIVHPIRDLFTIGERILFLGKVKQGRLLKGSARSPLAATFSGWLAVSVKRMADIILSLLLLFLLLPLMLMIAVWIRADSRGPVFHNTYRAGRGYRVFKRYRFRTGKVGAARLLSSLSLFGRFHDRGNAFIKASHKTGLTRAGKILAVTGLAALPQLLNVLKGDMSLVGNRPLPLSEASLLTSDELAVRFNVPAGLTGLWQVSREGQGENHLLRHELAYARDWSLLLDLRILLRWPAILWNRVLRSYRKGL